MRFKLRCQSVRIETHVTGSDQLALKVDLSGGYFTGATLELRVYESTPEQRAAFVVGNVYEVDVPSMPGEVPP